MIKLKFNWRSIGSHCLQTENDGITASSRVKLSAADSILAVHIFHLSLLSHVCVVRVRRFYFHSFPFVFDTLCERKSFTPSRSSRHILKLDILSRCELHSLTDLKGNEKRSKFERERTNGRYENTNANAKRRTNRNNSQNVCSGDC